MTKMVTIPVTLVLLLGRITPGLAAGNGIEVQPDEQGQFEYEDDFTTGRFVQDAFLTNLPIDCWTKGAITNTGPNRNRTLTYRFYGPRVIEDLALQVEQSANSRHLGSVNYLYLSANGLDWTLVASSSEQAADGNGWQSQPLTVTPEEAAAFLGRAEVWVRIVLDNYCGLPTHTSNQVTKLTVQLKVGKPAAAAADPQAELRAAWGQWRQKAGWQSIALDWADPVEQRPPHYYEDSDGWLQVAGANPHLAPDERQGFPLQRVLLPEARSPLSLAVFLQTRATAAPLLARMTVQSGPDSSRQMKVLWDGETAATFDVASFFEREQVFFVRLPGPQSQGVHELRLAGADAGKILVRQIVVAGEGSPEWVEKPPLPPGGRLEVLAAYYLPDPEPPAASQAVEGRTAEQEVGLVFQGLQRFYREHADFGAVRIVFRNDGRVPVRIVDPLRLNGRPLEESYVDFATTPWDAPGVVWYRVRPRLVQPGECGQVYVRFRQAPEGDGCTVELPLENGKPLTARLDYAPPPVLIDYVTTDQSRRTLYLYARCTSPAPPYEGRDPGGGEGEGRRGVPTPGRVTGASLDGETLADAKIYGRDFPGNVALIVADLPQRLELMSYHIAGIQTTRTSTAAQFRVLPFVFPRSSIHVPPELCRKMHMNLALWHEQDLATCKKYNLYTTTMEIFDRHERVSFILGPDEPDANDNRGGGYDRGLGYHARRLAHAGWQELIERHAPHAASWIIMNGTVRPLNWGVYGQLADVTCFDPYPINFYGADHAYVRESLNYVRLCGAPKPLYACLEAFGWQAGQGVPSGARGPIPAEWRQNVIQALGAGMKGLTSWVYVAGAGGWEINPPVAEEIAKLNRLIENIEDELLLGTPIDLAESDAGRVNTGTVGQELWPKERVAVGALLCGPDTIILAATNHIPAVKPDHPVIEPARNVTLTVQLPDYLRSVTAFEATEDGVAPFPCKVEGGQAWLKVDTLESGRVFVLRRK